MRIPHPSYRLGARALPVLAAAIALVAVAAAPAGAGGDRKVPVKLLGAPVLLEGAGTTSANSKVRHYVAAVRVTNSSDEWQTVLMAFNVLKGEKPVYSKTFKQVLPPGEGIGMIADIELPRAKYSINGLVLSASPAPRDDVLASLKLVGKPTLRDDGFGTCSWIAKVKNPTGTDADNANNIYFAGLRRGKIVSAGRAFLVFGAKAHATAKITESYSPCAKKMDAVKVYFESE